MPSRLLAGVVALGLVAACGAARSGPVEDQTLRNALSVISEFRTLSVQSIPSSLLRDAQGVAIIPGVIRVGFVLAGTHGRGVMFVRRTDGSWSEPLFVSLTGGSLGWQAGVDSTDVVLVFKSQRGVNGILSGQKFTLGADASIAAGPIGRQATAATDPRLQAEIFSYSRSRGLFAGVSLGGSVIRFDERSSTSFFGQFLTPTQIISAPRLTNNPSVPEIQAQLAAVGNPNAPPGPPPGVPGTVAPGTAPPGQLLPPGAAPPGPPPTQPPPPLEPPLAPIP